MLIRACVSEACLLKCHLPHVVNVCYRMWVQACLCRVLAVIMDESHNVVCESYLRLSSFLSPPGHQFPLSYLCFTLMGASLSVRGSVWPSSFHWPKGEMMTLRDFPAIMWCKLLPQLSFSPQPMSVASLCCCSVFYLSLQASSLIFVGQAIYKQTLYFENYWCDGKSDPVVFFLLLFF